MLMKNAIKKIIKMSGITVSSMAAAAFTAHGYFYPVLLIGKFTEV